jgi:lysylphosphatidylglycerol synthetase-like protein (DUF2156 family)
MDAFTLDFVIRIIARFGFIAVLIGSYKLWHLPVLRRHTQQFFWLATIICLASLLFTILEFLLTPETDLLFSLFFNAGTVWILAVYLNYRAISIRRKVDTKRINQFTSEVNKKIEELKNGT